MTNAAESTTTISAWSGYAVVYQTTPGAEGFLVYFEPEDRFVGVDGSDDRLVELSR